MTATLPLPWYRHFWPWFVLGLLGTSVVGSLTTVYIAVSGRDPEVRDGWRQDAKAVVRDDHRQRMASDLGLGADVSVTADTLRIRLDARPGLAPDVVSVQLIHPTIARRDIELEALPDESGEFVARRPADLGGRYTLSLRGVTPPVAGSDGAPWQMDAHVDLEPGVPVRLGVPRATPK